MGSDGKQKAGKRNSQGQRPLIKKGINCDNPLHPDGSCSCSDTDCNGRHAEENPSDNDLDASDASMEDLLLRHSHALTIEEVLRRRARRMKHLARLYRTHYWALMDDLKSNYADFYVKHGRSGWKEQAFQEAEQEKEFLALKGLLNGDAGPLQQGAVKCAFQGCKSKPMPLSSFCYAHILSDTRQQLYKPCSYVGKSVQSKPVTCGKPVLKAAVPSLCTVHFQKAQKHVARSLKRAGLNTSSSSKSAPKFHLIISEYVKHIQSKRREARTVASIGNVEKEGTCNSNASKDPSNH